MNHQADQAACNATPRRVDSRRRSLVLGAMAAPAWLAGPGVAQASDIKVRLHNQLPQPTTLHWHGLRVPNAFDGVPGITQAPVASGETFTYRFVAHDAGTFWYHPHFNSIEQVGRGLSGAVVVDEAKPVEVDDDWLWVLSDFRLDRQGQLVEGFENLRDAAHAGRLGNAVLINGTLSRDFVARPHARIRLRFVAATSARIFGLTFKGARAWLMAIDGHPVAATLLTEPLVLAPGQRADVLWEAPAANQTAQPDPVVPPAALSWRVVAPTHGQPMGPNSRHAVGAAKPKSCVSVSGGRTRQMDGALPRAGASSHRDDGLFRGHLSPCGGISSARQTATRLATDRG